MSGARGALAGVVALSLSLTLLPAAFAAPVTPWALAGAPAGAFRVDLAAIPGGGSMLVAAVGPSEAQIYLLAENGLGPAAALVSFPLAAEPDSAPLGCSRLAVLDMTTALIAVVAGNATPPKV